MGLVKFVLAPDSFKESLMASEVCRAMEEGIRMVFPLAEIIKIPMADGGEGTVEALVTGTQGEYYYKEVQGPLPHQRIKAKFGLLGDKQTAVIEMAEASGLALLNSQERNPLLTSTHGTGDLILAALDLGVQEIILGLGGSGTNDGGAGMAQALGVRFTDKAGQEIAMNGGNLKQVYKIDMSSIDPRIWQTSIRGACDVRNPLVGPEGAAAIYGPQKGANPNMVRELDENLSYFAQVIAKELNKEVQNIPSAGAAGGLGGGLLAFTSAKLESGIDLIIEKLALEEAIKNADYVWTGEGRIDSQSRFGKLPYGIARLCKANNIALIALAGSLGQGSNQLFQDGITALFSIMQEPTELDQALKQAYENIKKTSENIARLIKSSQTVG